MKIWILIKPWAYNVATIEVFTSKSEAKQRQLALKGSDGINRNEHVRIEEHEIANALATALAEH